MCDCSIRAYSYYIDVSMDQKDWVRVIDHRKYMCRSWQELYFPARVVRYIRIVGTYNNVNKVFHVVSLEAYYTNKPFKLDKNGILSRFYCEIQSFPCFNPNVYLQCPKTTWLQSHRVLSLSTA